MNLVLEYGPCSAITSDAVTCLSLSMSTTHQLGATILEETPKLRSYQPLDHYRREIRLIRFSGSEVQLETHCLDDKTVYHAISYYWGPPLPTREVCVEGEIIKLRKTVVDLFDCLRKRYGPETMFWIDMLCINQRNLDERNSQVTMMADIFSSAVDVISWLGEADDLSTTTFRHLKRNVQLYTDSYTQIIGSQAERPVPESTCVETRVGSDGVADGNCPEDALAKGTIMQAFRAIALKPYWSRVWVAQEVIVAQENWLLCGDDCAKLQALHDVGSRIVARSQPKDSHGEYDISDNAEHQEEINRWNIIQELQQFRHDFRNGGIGLRRLLQTFIRSDCSNPLDKVYGLRALNKTLSTIEVDYSKKSIEVFLSVLQAGFLHLDHGYGMHTLPDLAFNMGLSVEGLPADVNEACNAMFPIPVDGELIGRIVHATWSSCYGGPVQPEESLLIGACIKMTSPSGEARDQSGARSTSSYVLGDTYKPPNQPLWSHCVQAGDILVNIRSYKPITLVLRPQASRASSSPTVSGQVEQIYSAVANLEPSLVLPTATFENDSQVYLHRHVLNGTVVRGELVLSSPESANKDLQVGQALFEDDGGSGPVEDEALRYWNRDNSKLPELHRFQLDCASLPNLFLWISGGKINHVLPGTLAFRYW